MTRREPPRLPLMLLERLVPDSDPLAGDLVEEFRARPSSAWMWWQVLSAIVAARGRHDDEIRPLRLVDLQPVDAVERTRAYDRRARPVNLSGTGSNTVGGLGLFVIIALAGFAPSTYQPYPDRKPPVPIDAIQGVLDAFQTHTVVGLSAGADHGDARGPAFVATLIRDPRFRRTAIDVVVENANARHQDVMDRFTSGEDVPYEALRRVWDDTTQPQTIVTETPDFYRALREINTSLPRESRHRAILGDPPIDWNDVHTSQDFQKWLAQRDSYPADRVEREVLAKGRRALIVYGSGHLQRKQQASNYEMSSPLAQTVISLLDRRDARTFVVITVGDPFVPAVETDAWPVPSLATVRDTSLGSVPVGQGSLARVAVRDGTFTPLPRAQWVDLPVEQQIDAVLYLGPRSTWRQIARSKTVCDESGYVDTRLKRIALAGLPPPVAKEIQDFCTK